MANSAEEIERGRVTAERAVRELCQARGTKQPRFEWGPVADTPQRLEIFIEDLDPIEIEFRLAEVDSARVAIGSEIDVRVAPFPDEVFRASVSFVSPRIDAATRTLRVKGVLANPDGRLRPGLFAKVDLGVSDRSDVAMIPEDAMLQRADGSVAFRLLDGNRVERRVLTTGVFQDGYAEVVEGLEIGDLVVVRGHAALVDGAVVGLRRPDGSREDPQVPGVNSRSGAPE